MEIKRKPFQGVLNILRFNWHFYVFASCCLLIGFLLNQQLPSIIQPFSFYFLCLIALYSCTSILISYYIYDVSALYQLSWFNNAHHKRILNINVGFDETSSIIQSKFPTSTIVICDFYDPLKHTEISIKRARKAYPPHPSTLQVTTSELPFPNQQFDYVLTTLAAHEIRDEMERILFFKELNRVLLPTGEIYVTEHLRDLSNFVAYSIGCFHFYSKSSWKYTFNAAGFSIKNEIKTTPFITTFILIKHGTSH